MARDVWCEDWQFQGKIQSFLETYWSKGEGSWCAKQCHHLFLAKRLQRQQMAGYSAWKVEMGPDMWKDKSGIHSPL